MLRLNQVFKRIMHQPLNNLEEFWEKYNQFVLAQPLNVLATSDELKQLAGADDLMDEGLLRVKIVNALEAIKKKTAEGVYRRQAFESGIDRSYFHVTPVAESALRNWHNYLDYEEVAGDDLRCEALYERCLIACANYEDMWVRYAEWKEKTAGFDAANSVFQRAVSVFLKYRASIYLEYATFLEAHGKLKEASSTYMTVLTHVAPKLVEAYLRYCNFERRCQNLDKVSEWYGRALEVSKNDSSIHAHVASTFANYLHRSLNDGEQARGIYEHAIEHAGSSLLFWLNYIAFETSASSGTSEYFPSRVTQLYERAIADSSSLGNTEKSDLWLQYAEFTEMYGGSVQSMREIRQRELTWKRKNGVARDRSMKLLVWNVDSTTSSDESYEVGSKRPRVEQQQVATTTAAPDTSAVATSAAPASSAYAQQYAGYYQVKSSRHSCFFLSLVLGKRSLRACSRQLGVFVCAEGSFASFSFSDCAKGERSAAIWARRLLSAPTHIFGCLFLGAYVFCLCEEGFFSARN